MQIAEDCKELRRSSTDKLPHAGRVLQGALLSSFPNLLRDHKHHFKTLRQCCSGEELVDVLMNLQPALQGRLQAIGILQLLLDLDILVPVRQGSCFQDKDSCFFRFSESEPGREELPRAGTADDELQEAMELLTLLGLEALLTTSLRKPPSQRSADDLDIIYEELLHLRVLSHLTSTVRRQLAGVIHFESHSKAGTVLFRQGDSGSSWYILWRGSVSVLTHRQGVVSTLQEGDDFGELALVNDAPRAATIVLREDHCLFLRVDKEDFKRILKDVEANTVHLKEHGQDVLVLEKFQPTISPGQGRSSAKYLVMSGTPEKILEYLLDTVNLETTFSNPTDSFLGDFLQMHSIFMPTAQLHRALLTHYRSRAPGPEKVVAQEGVACRADPSVATKEKVLHLVTQWVCLLGARAQEDPAALALLQELRSLVLNDAELGGHAEDDGVSDNPKHEATRNTTVRQKLRNWLRVLDQVDGTCDRMGSSARERELVRRSERGRGASMGPKHRLCVCPREGPQRPCPTPAQQGPHQGLDTLLEGYSSKELAYQLNAYDWEIFQRIHELDVVEHVIGRGEGVGGGSSAHLDSFLTRFNQLQYWVVTGICLCTHLGSRSALLKKFIKVAARCKELRNMNSFFAVMFGLSNTAVRRLSLTWERLPSKHRGMFQDFERLLDPSRNHWAYRQTVRKFNSTYLPFLPLLLKDLTFIHEGNKTYLNGLVNFEKMRMLSRVVSVVRRCQCHQDAPAISRRSRPDQDARDPSLTPAPRPTSEVSEPSASGRREQTLRVYLKELRAIDNQGTLNRLSLELEPPRDRGPVNPPTAK